jgi:hypothetical protein
MKTELTAPGGTEAAQGSVFARSGAVLRQGRRGDILTLKIAVPSSLYLTRSPS